MKWTPGQDDGGDVEDRRGESGGGGMRLPIPGGARGLGLGGLAILLVLSLVFKQNFLAMLDGGGGMPVPAPGGGGPVEASPQEERLVQFVKFVVKDVQDTWEKEFARNGRQYQRAHLVLFRDVYPSGCGTADASSGPFYCPSDRKIYIDLAFYEDLQRRFGAPGEFAQAYVIAHEVGHHVQNLLGIAGKVHQLERARPDQANAASIRLELQADCLAGMWGRSTDQRQLLEKGDLESGMGAAAAVGDDRIQKMSTGRVQPERWTHGSSQQRVTWFRRGFDTGQMNACDTFSAP